MRLEKVEKFDLTMWHKGMEVMRQLREHHCTTKAETMYFDLFLKLCQDVLDAGKEGRPWVTNVMGLPVEIYHAMGLVGIEADMITNMINTYLDCHAEVQEACSALGIRPEICSAQRAPIGWFAKGWYPKPSAVIFNNICGCDNCAQDGNLMGELYDVPVYFVNRPYFFWTQKGIDMMTGELQDMITFLEETTGKKMDWDKLEECVRLTKKQLEISVEISKLGSTVSPCPIKGGTGFLLHWVRMGFAGTQEGVDYCQTFLDEMKEKIAQGKGYVEKERYRLINLFTFLLGHHELIDWMEKEKGAVFVAEPMYHRYNAEEVAKVDPSRPLEALARFYYLEPYHGFYGPWEVYRDMIVTDAIESGAEGAIDFFNSKCRMAGSMARSIKDTLREKAGIPSLVVDVELMDSSPATGADLLKQLEQFFLVLDNNKKKVAS